MRKLTAALFLTALLAGCGGMTEADRTIAEEKTRAAELATAERLERAEGRDPRKTREEEATRAQEERAKKEREVEKQGQEEAREAHREALKAARKRRELAAEERQGLREEKEIEEGVSLPPGVKPYASSTQAHIEQGCQKGGGSQIVCRCFVVQLEMTEGEQTALQATYAYGAAGTVARRAASGALDVCRNKNL